jgi:hypothetical protein
VVGEEASANIMEKAESVWVIAARRPVSPRLGDCPSFYRPRKEQFTCVPHYFPMCGGMTSSAMELTAVPVNPPQPGRRDTCCARTGTTSWVTA